MLEIPTPRWVVYDAFRYGVEIPEGAETVHQERAYTSPIWYTPASWVRPAVRGCLGGLALALLPRGALAHDAFGDLGPFYAHLLHPLADPAQGLVLAGIAAVLARQPLATVRPAYAALAAVGAIMVIAGATLPMTGLGILMAAGLACLLGGVALLGAQVRPPVAIACVMAATIAAGLAVTLPPGWRAGSLAALGAAAGIALTPLLLWGALDLVCRRISPLAGAVAGSWIAAIGILMAAFAL